MFTKTCIRYFFIIAAATTIASCRTTDKATQICETNNNECHRGCQISTTPSFDNKTMHQGLNPCDQRCENSYQSCLKRRQDRNIKGTGDY